MRASGGWHHESESVERTPQGAMHGEPHATFIGDVHTVVFRHWNRYVPTRSKWST